MPKRSSSNNTGASAGKKKRTDDPQPKSKTHKKSPVRNAKRDSDSDDAPPRSSAQSKSYPKEIDPTTNKEQEASDIKFTAKPPTRNNKVKGELVFEGVPDFHPNMTPKEVLQAGSFGGTYFRPIKSGITGKRYSGVWKELPTDWLEGLNCGKEVSSSVYDENVNFYKVKCGGSLDMWESSGWIHKQDPYGWFQWYCRFFQGRRTADDDRQIGRWLRCAGTQGRWRNNLISKCVKSNSSFDNVTVSPVVRQTLQHWGYKLTKEDYEAYAKKLRRKGVA